MRGLTCGLSRECLLVGFLHSRIGFSMPGSAPASPSRCTLHHHRGELPPHTLQQECAIKKMTTPAGRQQPAIPPLPISLQWHALEAATYPCLWRRTRSAAGQRMTTADKVISMDNIELLQQELEGAYQAAYAAPQGTSDWQPVNAAREKLNAAIEAAKTPEQRQIEALGEQIKDLQLRLDMSERSLEGARKASRELRHIIGLHTGKSTDKAIGNIAMDLSIIRKHEDDLAKFVLAGDMEGALRVCINRGLPRAPAANISEQVDRIGLPRMQA